MSDTYSFTRYLEAKKNIDDRSLNGRVWNKLWEELPSSSRLAPLQILEVGAGTGTMIDRILASNRLNTALYTAVDADEHQIAALNAKRQRWAESHPYFMVVAEAADALAFAQTFTQHITERASEAFDLLIAHAFLDLVNLPQALPPLFSTLKDNGLFYFTINFDGHTIFEPATTLGRDFDQHIIDLYHSTMPQPHTGRQLFQHISSLGGRVLAAGSSDWIVFGQAGQYPADEAYFLHHILHFFATSLHNHPHLPHDQFGRWLAERHAQIERGELIYIAHQLDLIGRMGSASAEQAVARAANFRAARQPAPQL